MHVVVYTDSAGIGGAEISLSHLVATASSDIDLTVVGVDATVVEAIARSRPYTHRIVLPASGRAALWQHYTTFHQLQPDVIHINLCTPWAGAIALATALSVSRARVVRVDQLPLRTTDLVTWLRTRLLCLRVDAHVAVGQASSRRMEDFYALGRNTVVSVPNGVPDVGVTFMPLPTDAPSMLHVGSIGRLDPVKGHDVLLNAIARVERTKLTILGEGEYRPQLEQLIDQLGVGDRVSLPGWIDQPQQYLSTFDVVAQPSRSEGFPLSVVEAMLAARPIIATRVGSVAEAITNGISGLLIDKDDVDGLAAALTQLRDDAALRCQLGQQARAIASQQFTVEHMTAQYEALWHQVIHQPQKPRLRVPRPRD